MSEHDADRLAELEAQEALELLHFDQSDAWELGRLVTERALAEGLTVLIDIRRPNLVLFRAALPGTRPDQEVWAERKARVTLRLECSSALAGARFKAWGVNPTEIGWLDHSYAPGGGSFPIRVTGVGVVAAITGSGLTSDEDHDLVRWGVAELRARQVSARDSATHPVHPRSAEQD
ncbi:heme-degrading domain-containing protein [Aestuariimicrobium soli]|uniref:heme-degrading domain-containing protein n=1 Tax=Aestuariimicrobium soli TaxID=2035834 RepID=UPI003EBD7734